MVKKKNKDEITVPVPDAKTPPGIPVDEFHGLGGSYVIDPVTGKRTRVAGPIEPKSTEQPATEQPEAEAVSNES
ncbi:MAG: hypothetical protein JNL77_05550 [Nitrosomonas sp.]|nr:hypothetical protein [Nitrosomonas sp.]